MTMMGPIDHQANFESDAWNAFNALGMGYRAFLTHPSNGPSVWFIAPEEGLYGFHRDVDVIQELIDKGLVAKKDDDLIPDSEARYELTDEGQSFFGVLSNLASIEAQKAFIAKIQPMIR